MLAARDQENRVFAHQTAGAAKQNNLLPKTPGARYPKTPLKVPLNDENATTILGGKSVLVDRTKGAGNENTRTIGKSGKGVDKTSLVTPFEPRTSRAPLGNKTTNAKARIEQGGGVKSIVKEFEKTQARPTTSQRPRIRSPQTVSSKLEVHTDRNNTEEEAEPEFAPLAEPELPYESDILPTGALNFDVLKPENRLKGYYQYYHNPVDEDGVTRKEKQMAQQQQQAFDKLDAQVLKDLDAMDWSIDDGPNGADYSNKPKPESTNGAAASANAPAVTGRFASRAPSTIASRRAASALSMAPKSSALQPKAVKPVNAKATSFLLPGKKAPTAPILNPQRTGTAAAVASRTTFGYSKGRSASSALHGRIAPATGTTRTFARTASTASSGSDTTITPARYAMKQANKKGAEAEELKRLEFLSIFDGALDDGGDLADSMPLVVDSDDEFQLTPLSE